MKALKKSIFILLIIIILSTLSLPYSALANQSGAIAFGAANVATSGLRIRSGPSTKHDILHTLNQGSVVVILERTSREWFRINYNGTVGFVNTSFIENVREAANFNAKGRVTGSMVNVRDIPNTSGEVVVQYPTNSVLNIVGINKGWYKINQDGLIGYIRSDLVKIVSGGTPTTKSRGQQIADYAMQFRGTPYVWAGTSPSGFDCSGLVTYVYKHFGIRISRSATAQYRDNGVPVSRNSLLPGDLVFFTARGGSTINHVGIYIGGGKFVHASGPNVGVVVNNLNSGTYADRWFGAKRIV